MAMKQLTTAGCSCKCGCAAQLIGEHTDALCRSCAASNGMAIVALAESPSTGYIWRSEELPSGVTILSDHYLVADPARERIGGVGRHLFILTGPAGSSAEVTWQLGRPWMKESWEWLVTEVSFGDHSLPEQRRAAA